MVIKKRAAILPSPCSWKVTDAQRVFDQAVERKSLPLVKLLQKEYAPTLEKDPGIATELSAIEVKYCGAQVGQGMGGLFGGMLRSLMAAE